MSYAGALVKFIVVMVVLFMALGAFPELLTGAGYGKWAWLAIGLIFVAVILGGGMTIKNIFSRGLLIAIAVFLVYGALTRSAAELAQKPAVWKHMGQNAMAAWQGASLSEKLSFLCAWLPGDLAGDECRKFLTPVATVGDQAVENRIQCMFNLASSYDAQYPGTNLDQQILTACRAKADDRKAYESCIRTSLQNANVDVPNTCLVGQQLIQPK